MKDLPIELGNRSADDLLADFPGVREDMGESALWQKIRTRDSEDQEDMIRAMVNLRWLAWSGMVTGVSLTSDNHMRFQPAELLTYRDGLNLFAKLLIMKDAYDREDLFGENQLFGTEDPVETVRSYGRPQSQDAQGLPLATVLDAYFGVFESNTSDSNQVRPNNFLAGHEQRQQVVREGYYAEDNSNNIMPMSLFLVLAEKVLDQIRSNTDEVAATEAGDTPDA